MFLTQHYLKNVVAVLHTYLDHLTSVMFTVTEMFFILMIQCVLVIMVIFVL